MLRSRAGRALIAPIRVAASLRAKKHMQCWCAFFFCCSNVYCNQLDVWSSTFKCCHPTLEFVPHFVLVILLQLQQQQRPSQLKWRILFIGTQQITHTHTQAQFNTNVSKHTAHSVRVVYVCEFACVRWPHSLRHRQWNHQHRMTSLWLKMQ